MKKSLTAIAIAAIVGAPMFAQADEGPTVFGSVHVSLDKAGKDSPILSMSSSRGTVVGVRGNVDTNLMGMKAIYQAGIGFDTQNNADTAGAGVFYMRDTWVGLSSKEYGTARGGLMDIHYKDVSKNVDPFLTTALEGRLSGSGMRGNAKSSGLRTMGGMGGSNDDGGRQGHTARYDSPSVSGVKVSANYGFAGDGKDNFGIGAEYSEGGILAFVDHVSIGMMGALEDATMTKIGGKYTMGDMSFAAQYEMDGDALSGVKDGDMDMMFAAGTYTMGATTFALTVGMSAETKSDAKNGNTSFALGAKHALAKKTTIYGGLGMVMNDEKANVGNNANKAGDDSTIVTVGLMTAF